MGLVAKCQQVWQGNVLHRIHLWNQDLPLQQMTQHLLPGVLLLAPMAPPVQQSLPLARLVAMQPIQSRQAQSAHFPIQAHLEHHLVALLRLLC